MFIIKEKNMRSSTNHSINIALFNIEMNIQSIQDILIALTKKIIDHLNPDIPFLLVFHCI